jgi:hypothetical protein
MDSGGGAQRWLIITRDRHIQENRREIISVREHGARMVALSARMREARSSSWKS